MPPDPREAARQMLASLAPAGAPMRFRTPLEADESRWFLRAVSEGIVHPTNCGSDCPRLRKTGVTGPDHFQTPSGQHRHLFSKPGADEAWLNREYVPHIAAYAFALLSMGYDMDRTSFSKYRKFSRDLIAKRQRQSFETDAEFYDATGEVHLQVEAKGSPRETAILAASIAGQRELAELPARVVKEIEYVLDLRPKYLWVVGPGTIDPPAHVFHVTTTERNAHFEQMPRLPEAPR